MTASIEFGGASQLKQINADLINLYRPPRRITVSECATENLKISRGEKFDPNLTPYMLEPMDAMSDRRHDVMCFVGPQRTGKTFAVCLGGMVYFVVAHPLDFAIVHSSKDMASDMSAREIERLQVHSPGMRAAMTGRSRDDNTHRKRYKNGVLGVIVWPSPTELASRTIPVMILTDYGRWPANIGGGANGFDESRKRTQTVGSLGMTAVEGAARCEISPEDDTRPQKYELGKPLMHAFPATQSKPYADICPIYNGGDRRWWYVPCASCGEYYPQEPKIERFSWGTGDPVEAAKDAGTVCPWCASIHAEDTKNAENAAGVWVAEGETIDWQGNTTGVSRRGATYPSFSLGGGGAAYQTRQSIVQKYLENKLIAESTGDENPLKQITNSDIGGPYLPLLAGIPRAIEPLKNRAKPFVKKTVPEGVRFILMLVDVQANRFVCQAMGYGPDRNRCVIDRFSIVKSNRLDPNGQRLAVNPGVYLEDWPLLAELLDKSYLLSDGTGRRMMVAQLGIDSGGQDKVTENAAAFWRRLEPRQKVRTRLVKGEHKPAAPIVDQRWPNTKGRADRSGATQGDVPILFLNVNQLKNTLEADLQRNEPGMGFIEFPDWLPNWFYAELTREKKDKDGRWKGTGRNEAWDLMVYGDALAMVGYPFRYRPFGLYGTHNVQFWSNPPAYARDWDKNAMVFSKDEQEPAALKNNGKMKQRPRRGLFG